MDISEIMSGLGSSQALQDAAGQAGIDPSAAQGIVQGVLAHAADGGAPEDIVESVAAKAGIDPSIVQQFLPQVLPLLQGHADNAAEGSQGALGELMGSVGGLLGGGESGGGLGGLMGLASGFLGRK